MNRTGSSHVSDAMEHLSLPRAVIHGLRLLGPEGAIAIGPAFTVSQGSKRTGASRDENLVRHGEAAELAEPGSIIVVDIGGRLDVASWGENQARKALARGMGGVLLNGCTRDGSAVARTGVPTFCRGLSPIKSRWDLETIALNEPVVVGGVQINPGDMLIGDEDGVVVCPIADYAAVRTLADDIARLDGSS